MGADHVQRGLGQAGDVVGMADDPGVQGAVLAVVVADVDRGEDLSARPGPGGLGHQYRAGREAQQFPVVRGEDGLFQRVVGKVLLDDQPAAFGLLLGDDGLVQGVLPGLVGRDAVAFLAQFLGQVVEGGAVVAALLADQQVQVRLGHAGDQLCPFQGETFQLVRFNHHEDAANGLHDRLPECLWLSLKQL